MSTTAPSPALPHEALFQLNGQSMPWTDAMTVEFALLTWDKNLNPDAVATALNGQFVSRSERAHTSLQPDDQLTVFQAIVGG